MPASRVSLRRPLSIDDALQELTDEDSMVLAGGQGITALMNLGLLQPKKLVSVAGLTELQGVSVIDDYIDLGAMCTHGDLASNVAVKQYLPAVAEMFASIGNVRVRSMGTIGGNLAHADPAQDPQVILTALGAHVVVRSPGAEHRLALDDLAIGPFESALQQGELLARVRIPRPPVGAVSTYMKFMSGSRSDYATASIALAVEFGTDSSISDARLVAGAIGMEVELLATAGEILVGMRHPGDRDVLQALKDSVRLSVSPITDRHGSADYKREVVAWLAGQAVDDCFKRARALQVASHQGP